MKSIIIIHLECYFNFLVTKDGLKSVLFFRLLSFYPYLAYVVILFTAKSAFEIE